MSLTPEQVESRRQTIGGSDIGAILGENPYKTAYELWEEKVEGKSADFSKNKSVVIGNLLEHALLKKCALLNNKSFGYLGTVFHKEYKFLSANIDGLLINEDLNIYSMVEIKTASIFNKDDWGPSGSQIVPNSYYAQISHYMMVKEYDQAEIFVGFVDDSVIGEVLCELNASINEKRDPDYTEIVNKMETRLYTFYRDPEMEALILESAISFYENHMKPWIEHGIKNPPPMDFSNKKFQDHLKKKYSIQEESQIKLSDEFIKIKDKYLSNMVQSKFYERLAQEEKAKVIEAMGNNQKAILSDGSYFLRKMIKRKECVVKASEYIKFELKQPKDKS